MIEYVSFSVTCRQPFAKLADCIVNTLRVQNTIPIDTGTSRFANLSFKFLHTHFYDLIVPY